MKRRRVRPFLTVLAALLAAVPLVLAASPAPPAAAEDELMNICLQSTTGEVFTVCAAAAVLGDAVISGTQQCGDYLLRNISQTRRGLDEEIYSVCVFAEQTLNDVASQAVDATLYCASLGDDPGLASLGPVCRQLVADAIVLAGQAGELLLQCATMANDTCRTAYETALATVNAVVAGVQWCLGLGGDPGFVTIGEICRQALDGARQAAAELVLVLTAAVDEGVARVTACVSGADPTCRDAMDAVDEALVQVLALQRCADAPGLPLRVTEVCVPSEPDLGRLLSIAQESVEAAHRYRVEGAPALASIGGSQTAANFGAWLAVTTPELDEERAAMTASRLAYTYYTVDFRSYDLSTTLGTATLHATVYEELGLAPILGKTESAPNWSGMPEKYFTFVPDGNGDWRLAAVEDNDIGGLYYPAEPVEETAVPAPGTPMEDSLPAVESTVSLGETADDTIIALKQPAENDSTLRKADKAEIVRYALAHVYNPNPAYRNFPNDCTNFVSQALESGGWAMTEGTGYDPEHEWWYSYETYYARGWTIAQRLYNVIYNNRWATAVNSVWSLRPGDVLQASMTSNGYKSPNTIDHSTIVTKRDPDGVFYLTYRTANQRNKPWAKFKVDSGKGSKFYGWRIAAK